VTDPERHHNLRDALDGNGRMVDRSGTKEESTVALNIKSNETHRMAQELAELTGETQTEAVTIAIRERLDRLQRRKSREGRRTATVDQWSA